MPKWLTRPSSREVSTVIVRSPNRVHVDPSNRTMVGQQIAIAVESIIRAQAPSAPGLLLCPGCTMIALFDAFITLALANGFSVKRCASQLGSALTTCASVPPSTRSAVAESLR